jgi:plasmid stabilization system protein ParE
MPYDNPKQATAIFLDIKRKQGLSAAKAFGRKHREDLQRGQQMAAGTKSVPYTPRPRKGA